MTPDYMVWPLNLVSIIFSLKKYVFVFCCKGRILLILFGHHIFPSRDWKRISVASWPLPKKVYFGQWKVESLQRNKLRVTNVFFNIEANGQTGQCVTWFSAYVPLKRRINTDGYTCNVYDLFYYLLKYLSNQTVR